MTEETKVETNEEKQLESFENPFTIEPFATPPIMVFHYKDDVSDLRERAIKIPFDGILPKLLTIALDIGKDSDAILNLTYE